MNYAAAKTLKNEAAEASKRAAAALNTVKDALMQAAGMASGAFNMTPDAVKFSPEFKAAKSAFDAAFERERQVNAWFCKTYRKEYAAERAARFAA